jgi:hypothetical protein
MVNLNAKQLVRILIDEFGMKKETIAGEVGSSVRSVERWYDGTGQPLPVYEDKLKALLVQKRMEQSDGR